MIIDLLAGLIASFIISDFSFSNPALLVFALIFSLLPDLDFLIYHSIHPIDRLSHRHRRIFHLPIPFLLIGGGILYFFQASQTTMLLFFVLSLWHFVHDTFSLGWGVQWLFPFSRRHLRFLRRIFGLKSLCHFYAME